MSDTWTGTVDAKLEKGQPTGFTANKGDIITIVASGFAERASGEKFGPQGDPVYKRTGLTSQEALVGALLVKIGNQVFPVNSGLFRWEVPAGGELVFLFNDVPGIYGDNSGAFNVSVGLDRPAPREIWAGQVEAKLEKGCATGITVKQGDVIAITASGTAQRASGTPFGPDGDAGYKSDGLLFQDAPAGSLIMRIGGQYFPVKSKLSNWMVPVEGEITFFFNDKPLLYKDNTGAFAVKVQQIPAA